MKTFFIILISFILGLLFVFYTTLILCAIYMKDTEKPPNIIFAPKLTVPFKEGVEKIFIFSKSSCYLSESEEYLSVSCNEDYYLDETIEFLSKTELSDKEKDILIEMMQGLNYENYLRFFEACTNLYMQDKLSDGHIIGLTILYSEYNNKIFRGFYKPKVRHCLRQIKAKTKNKSIKQIANGVLYGVCWFYVVGYYSVVNYYMFKNKIKNLKNAS